MATTNKNILGLDEVLQKMREHSGKSNPLYEQAAKDIEERAQVLETIANNVQSVFFNQPQEPRE